MQHRISRRLALVGIAVPVLGIDEARAQAAVAQQLFQTALTQLAYAETFRESNVFMFRMTVSTAIGLARQALENHPASWGGALEARFGPVETAEVRLLLYSASIGNVQDAYEAARKTDRQRFPVLWAETQDAVAHAELQQINDARRGKAVPNYAASAWENALEIAAVPAATRARYAHDLAQLYIDRVVGDRRDNLTRALEVLRVAQPNRLPRSDALRTQLEFETARASFELARLDRNVSIRDLSDVRRLAEATLRAGNEMEAGRLRLLLGEMALDAGDVNFALQNLDQAVVRLGGNEHADMLQRAYGRRGQALLRRGDVQGAIEALGQAIPAPNTSGRSVPPANLDVIHEFCLTLGDAHARLGDWSSASAAYERGFGYVGYQYDVLIDTRVSLQRAERTRVLYRQGAFAAVREGKLLDAVRISEAGRAILLGNAILYRELFAGEEGQLARTRFEALASAEANLARPGANRATGEAAIALARHGITSSFYGTSRGDGPDSIYVGARTHWGYESTPGEAHQRYNDTLSAMRSVVVIESDFGAGVFAFPQRRAPVFTEAQNTAANTTYTGPAWESPELSGELATALQAGIAALNAPAGSRITVTPGGKLGRLPIGLIRNSATGRYLIEDYEIVTTPSAYVAHEAEKRARTFARATPSLLALANPGGADDLPFTEVEAQMVAAPFGARARVLGAGQANSADEVARQLAGANYWHLSTHGRFETRDAFESSIDLSNDARLSARDVYDRRESVPPPRLAFLSACETGLAGENSDEFIGLPLGLLALGAAGVIASLWQVPDLSTSLLCARFYELHLRERQAPPTALRNAQLWLRGATRDQLEAYLAGRGLNDAMLDEALGAIAEQDGDPPFADPQHWAAWVYFGA